MVEVGVVFHQVAIRVSINVRCPAQQVAGSDGRFGPQGFQEILHFTIEPAVQLDAELHGVGVAGGAVLTAPVPGGLVDRLHKSTFRDAHGAGCWVFVLPQGTDALIGPSLLQPGSRLQKAWTYEGVCALGEDERPAAAGTARIGGRWICAAGRRSPPGTGAVRTAPPATPTPWSSASS